MRRKTFGFIVVALLATVVLGGAAVAAAGVHITSDTLGGSGAPFYLTASLTSTGDAGDLLGNMNEATDPHQPLAHPFPWVNQPVSLSNFHMYDTLHHTVLIGKAYTQLWWGALTPYTGELSAEGIYSITTTGTYLGSPVPTTTISPAFGIDRTYPDVHTDTVPIYSGNATVTVTATDTMSGVEVINYSVDGGPWNLSSDAPTGTVKIPVGFGVGTHYMWWHALDNAGNINSGFDQFIVRPLGFVPTVTLGAKGSGSKGTGHSWTFSGGVSPMASSSVTSLVVQRWSKKKWHYYKTFYAPVPKFVGTYSVKGTIKADGTYRVIAGNSGGSSSWKKFKVK